MDRLRDPEEFQNGHSKVPTLYCMGLCDQYCGPMPLKRLISDIPSPKHASSMATDVIDRLPYDEAQCQVDSALVIPDQRGAQPKKTPHEASCTTSARTATSGTT